MSRQKVSVPSPSPEALAQAKERQRREADLSSFGRNKVKNGVGSLLKGVLASRKDINAAEVSPLGGLSTMTGSSPTVLPPSWAANIVSLEEIREEEANQTLAATNASYPLPMPRLTSAQQQIHKKTDLLQSTSAAAVATANASKEALSLVGSALTYMVPKVLQDAPRYMLEGAVDSVGVTLTSYDLSGLEQAARVSFFKMEREAPLTGLTIAFKRLMITLRDFKFNKAVATELLRKLYLILSAFSKPYTGVIAFAATDESKALTDAKIKGLIGAVEECLDRGNKFLCRFASLDGSVAFHAFPRNPALDAVPRVAPMSLVTASNAPYVPLPDDPWALRPLDLSPNDTFLYAAPNSATFATGAAPSSATTQAPVSVGSVGQPGFFLGGFMAGNSPQMRPFNNVIGKRSFVCDYVVMAAVVGKELRDFIAAWHEGLVKSVEDLLLEIGLFLATFDIDSTPPETLVFGSVEAEMRTSTESTLLSIARRSGSAEELQILGGLRMLNMRMEATRSFITRRLTSYPHDVILSPPLKEWWFKYFGVLQRCTPDDFIKMIALEAGGKSDVDSQRLLKICTDLQTALSSKGLEKDATILLTEYARLFQPVPCDEADFFTAMEIAAKNAADTKIKLLPPLSDLMGTRSIVWDFYQEADLGRLIQDAKGWRLVTGPRGSGKSTRVLSTLHSMPKGRDVLYVDLSTCRETSDVIHATISQLLLRDCKNYDDFVDRFGEFLKNSVRNHGVIVFDNFEVDHLEGSAREQAVHGFETTLRKISGPFLTKCLFVLVSSSVPPDTLNRQPQKLFSSARPLGVNAMTIAALSEANALVLAKELLPVDPSTLMMAGRNLGGEMARIAQTCSLGTIRKMAAILTIDPSAVHVAHKCMMEGIESEMTADEKLCAACMLTGLPHFNEGHAWALCRDAFEDNVLRWRVAWQGLVDVGWVASSSSLGFWLPANSVISSTVVSPAPISLATQVRAYIFYWASELVRVNNFSYDSSAYLLNHDKYRKHFRSVLCNFLLPTGESGTEIASEAVSKETFTEELRLYNPSSDLTPLGLIVAGKLERVLSLRYSDAFGLAVAQGVLSTLSAHKQSLIYMKALRDLASQLLRAKRMSEAEDLVTTIATRTLIEFKDLPLFDRALFSASSANMYLLKKRFVDCRNSLLIAQTYLEQDCKLKSVSEFTPGTLNWVKRSIIQCDADDKLARTQLQLLTKRRACVVM